MYFYPIIVKHNQNFDIKNADYFTVNNQKLTETISIRQYQPGFYVQQFRPGIIRLPARTKEDQSYSQSKRGTCNIET